MLLSENFYWRNARKELDYTDLNSLPAADVQCRMLSNMKQGKAQIEVSNHSATVAFGNRLRLVDAESGERILPVIMDDNYITLMPGEKRIIDLQLPDECNSRNISVLLKQYGKKEKTVINIER